MNLLVVGLILSITLAVTASVFAIWPVVADAPWEDDVNVPVVVESVDQIRCEGALRLRESATEGLGNASGRFAFRSIGILKDQLNQAQNEINRYCLIHH